MKKIIILLMLLMVVAFSAVIVSAADVAITKIDGQTPAGGVVSISSDTPTFQGTSATHGSVVSVYDRTVGGVPSINKVAEEDYLSLTYQPPQPSPGFFSDNFDDGNWQDNWKNMAPSGVQEPSESGGALHLYPWGGVNSNNILSVQNQSFTIEADIKIPIQYDINNPNAAIDFGINEQQVEGCGQGGCSPGSHLSIRWSDAYGSSEICLTQSNQIERQCLPHLPPVIGQTYHLKFTYDGATNTAQGFIDDMNTPVISATINPLIYQTVTVSLGNWDNYGDWDNLTTNFPLPGTPEGYLLARTGMSLDGVNYMDDVGPLFGSPTPVPGVLWFGSQGPVPLPAFINEHDISFGFGGGTSPRDMYVYLLTLTHPQAGTFKATIYDVKTPEEFAVMVVQGLASQGFAASVESFAKAFTYSGSNTYTSATLPLQSIGRIAPVPQSIQYTWPPYLNYVNGAYQMSVSPLEYNGEAHDMVMDQMTTTGIMISISQPGSGSCDDGWSYLEEPINPVCNWDPNIKFDGTKNISAFVLGGTEGGLTFRWTIYTDGNQDAVHMDWQPYIVDSVMNIFTANGAGQSYTFNEGATYTNSGLPVIGATGTAYTTEVAPPIAGVTDILLANANADSSGNWIAYFGKDAFGGNIPGLTDLLGLHGSPYTFVAKDSSGGESNIVLANLVSGPPSITKTCPSTTGCSITLGGITFHIVPGALSADTEITIEEDQTVPVEFELSTNQGVALVSKVFAYNIKPDGTTLSGTGSYVKFAWNDPLSNEGNLKIIKNGVALTDKCVNDPGCDAAANTFQVGINSFSQWIFAEVPDTDGDGITDELDQCKNAQGQAAYNGCPAGIKVNAVKHTIDSTLAKPKSVKYPLPGLIVKLFDKSDGSCAASYGISWQNYPNIDENCAPVAICITGANGECIIGALPGDYVVIGRHISTDGNGQTVTIDDKHLGVSASDLAAGQLMQKNLQLLEVPDLNNGGTKKLPASTKKITGSYLEILQPDYVIWSGTEELYPFIFTSDANWTVDICLLVPEGYRPVEGCMQDFVNGETKALQFRVIEVGSVPDDTSVTFDLQHKDKKGKTVRQRVTSKIGAKMTPELAKAKASKEKGKSPITGAATYKSGEPMRSLVIVAAAGIAVIAALALLMLHKKK